MKFSDLDALQKFKRWNDGIDGPRVVATPSIPIWHIWSTRLARDIVLCDSLYSLFRCAILLSRFEKSSYGVSYLTYPSNTFVACSHQNHHINQIPLP
jgi:hypothetical protein